MGVNVFVMADNCRQTRDDGSTYYFMATATHKTGATDLAFIYIDEKDGELFRIYKNNIRKMPIEGDENYLFINKNGRRIGNPSGDIKILTQRYGVEMTCNDARHTIEAIGKHYCSKEEQTIIHRMLTHSGEAAQRHYMEPHSASLPHRKGIPMLEKLLRHISGKHHVSIASPLSGSLALTTDTSTARDNIAVEGESSAVGTEHVDAPPRSVSPTSSESSCESADKTDRFKMLMQRAFPGMHAELLLPGHSAVRSAIIGNPDLKLKNEKKTWSGFVEHCRYQRILARAEECANHYRRNKVSDFHTAANDLVQMRSWAPEKRLLKNCAQKLETDKKSRNF